LPWIRHLFRQRSFFSPFHDDFDEGCEAGAKRWLHGIADWGNFDFDDGQVTFLSDAFGEESPPGFCAIEYDHTARFLNDIKQDKILFRQGAADEGNGYPSGSTLAIGLIFNDPLSGLMK